MLRLAALALVLGLASPARAEVPAPIEDASGQALDAFHRSLRRTARGLGQTRILQFGASHTAADLFTGYLRHFFQARFGDAGHGYIMPAKPWPGYKHLDVHLESSAGWLTERAGAPDSRDDGLYGLAGFACSSSSKDDWAWVGTSPKSPFGKNVSRFEVFYLAQPSGGSFDLLVDGEPYERVQSRAATASAGYTVLRVPDGPHTLEIRPLGDGEVRLLGTVMERTAPGVVVDTLGINGARAAVQLRWDEALWRSQIRRRAPDLVLLAYGTNESGDDGEPIDRYEQHLRTVLERVRGAVPYASCVLVGPTDRPVKSGRRFEPRARTDEVIRVQRDVGARFGCGFWDAYRAMGGPLSIVRWANARPPLAQKDHVHLTAKGYAVLSEGIALALLEGYSKRD